MKFCTFVFELSRSQVTCGGGWALRQHNKCDKNNGLHFFVNSSLLIVLGHSSKISELDFYNTINVFLFRYINGSRFCQFCVEIPPDKTDTDYSIYNRTLNIVKPNLLSADLKAK